jgi:hypothetical protein
MIDNLSPDIIKDIQRYQFQHEIWTCWITCIKNILTTMKRRYENCPNPSINKLNKIVGAERGIIPSPTVVTASINEKILKNTKFRLVEKINSNFNEVIQILENKNNSPVIFSVASNEYFKEISKRYKNQELGYSIEGSSKMDHTLIAFEITNDVVFFDPYMPHLRLFTRNSPEKAMFKLSNIIINRLWLNAYVPNWIMWLERQTSQTTLYSKFKKGQK